MQVPFISFSLLARAGIPYLSPPLKAGTCTKWSDPEDWARPVLNHYERDNRARQAVFLIQKLETRYPECENP